MRHLDRAAAVLAGMLALAGAPWAQLLGDFTLDPRTVPSPSGAVTLHVDPQRRDGSGPARYRCARGDEELWAGERPWTLWEAEVTDEGVVAGYAYAAGYMGGRDDALLVVVLGPDGEVRLGERHAREGLLSDMGRPEPMVNGLFVAPDQDRLVVRVSTGGFDRTETWWTYALSSGAPGPRLAPFAESVEERAWGVAEARSVPGTGLVLVRRHWRDIRAREYGSEFTLLDGEARPVWGTRWPTDLTASGGESANRLLFNEFWKGGVLLGTADRRFTLRRVATNERVTFAVERVTDQHEGWEVREVAVEPFEEVVAAAPEPGEELELELLGTITLGSARASVPVRDVMDFALDGRGRIGFLRRTEDRMELVRVEPDGANAVAVELPGPPEGAWWTYHVAWTRDDRWVATGSAHGGTQENAWWVDLERRDVTPVEGYSGPSVEGLAGTPDGGFVVLGTTWFESGYSTNHLNGHGPDGRLRFALGGDQGDPEDPSSLFAPMDLTVLSDGRIAVLGNVQDTVTFFDATGEFLHAIDLVEAWGREPRYLAAIHADVDDGLIVQDFDGQPPIDRLDPTGAILSGFEPRHPDGRTFQPRGDVQAAPDGTLWTSDGDALFALDATGVVQRVLGAPPEASELGTIEIVALGPGDRIHAADERTGAVHVFAPDGTPEHVCVPMPGDFDGRLVLAQLTVDAAGEVYLQDVHFAADGRWLERSPLRSGRDEPRRYARPGGDGFWALGRNELRLLDATGEDVRTLERTPDDRWLRNTGRAAVAPDGSIAVETSALLGGGHPGIHLYAADGTPVRTFASPRGMPGWANFAFDGKRLAIGVRGKDEPAAVVLMDVHGRELGRLVPDGDVEYWFPFFAAGGRELWLFDGERTIRRHAAP